MKRPGTNIWIYAVILFSSAFVVLTLTAYSQIKFNKNIDDYRNSLHNQEVTISKHQINLSSALEENKVIREEITRLRQENSKLKEEKQDVTIEMENIQKAEKSYNILLKAIKEYMEGNYEEAANRLYDSDFSTDGLTSEAKAEYDEIIHYLKENKAEELYSRGYNLYTAGMYAEAKQKFLLCNKLRKDAYYSDDCYYLIISCLLHLSSIDEAEIILNEFKEEIPLSELIENSEIMISNWQQRKK